MCVIDFYNFTEWIGLSATKIKVVFAIYVRICKFSCILQLFLYLPVSFKHQFPCNILELGDIFWKEIDSFQP